MNENVRRREGITSQLVIWMHTMPRLVRRVDDALCLPHLAHAQRANIVSIGERIGLRFRAIQVAVDSDGSYEHLIATMDRLREEIATSDQTLDRLLLPRI